MRIFEQSILPVLPLHANVGEAKVKEDVGELEHEDQRVRERERESQGERE